MTRRPRVVALIFSMMLLALGSKEARAQLSPQQKQEIHVHYQQATRAYDLGKYQEAIDEYQKVYEIDGDPVMLYNIAQAYRLNDQPQEAIHFYRRYLQRSPDARNKDDVERKIAAQEKLIEERRKAAAAVSPPPPKPAPPPVTAVVPPPAPPPEAKPVVVSPPPPPPPPAPPSTTGRVVGWSMVGAGVASGVVAVIEGVRAKDFADKVTQMSQSGTVTWNSTLAGYQSSGKTANIVAIACGIGGAVVAVAGAVVLITNGPSSPPAASDSTPADSTNVSFAPWLGPGVVGGGMGLRF
ncbi:MAG TPA: tetratricopeptide repeat protein [Polyangia bacterium]|nr:tetratricopeptide repeat protein [Polyangia bacterium]